MLHIVTQSPWQSGDLQQCLTMLTAEDAVVLTQDAVLAAVQQTPFYAALLARCSHCYVLHADLVARGVATKITDGFQVIDYDQWVALTETQTPVLTW